MKLLDFVVIKECEVGFTKAFENDLMIRIELMGGKTKVSSYCTFEGYLSKTKGTNIDSGYNEIKQLKQSDVTKDKG